MNKLKERNPKYELIETNRGIEFLCNCWQHCLQPASQKFTGIIHQNQLSSHEVKDDTNMDLYNSRMREVHALHVNTCRKDMLKILSKFMKAFHFLSNHPKIEVEFPIDVSKHPPTHPNSIMKNNLPSQEQIVDTAESNIFMRTPTQMEQPTGQVHSKCVDAINFVIDKVKQQVFGEYTPYAFVQTMWNKVKWDFKSMTSR